MIYGYIRVSTDRQSVENQRYEISQYCARNAMRIGRWIEEEASGVTDVENRKLGVLLCSMRKGDILMCAELSRLGRNLLMIMSILNQCMKAEIQVWTVKDNYRLGADINSKVLAFAFGLSAEIERNLISQRTKEALARTRSEGTVLGRPKGGSSRKKLAGREQEVMTLVRQNVPLAAISRIIGVHRMTLAAFVKSASAVTCGTDDMLEGENEILE